MEGQSNGQKKGENVMTPVLLFVFHILVNEQSCYGSGSSVCERDNEGALYNYSSFIFSFLFPSHSVT